MRMARSTSTLAPRRRRVSNTTGWRRFRGRGSSLLCGSMDHSIRGSRRSGARAKLSAPTTDRTAIRRITASSGRIPGLRKTNLQRRRRGLRLSRSIKVLRREKHTAGCLRTAGRTCVLRSARQRKRVNIDALPTSLPPIGISRRDGNTDGLTGPPRQSPGFVY